MRILIADDEPLALRRLETALACIPEAEIVATASTGGEARRLIARHRPDVAILDIEMPDQTGLSVIETIGPDDHMPEVIFATAFRHYAVQAFELAAVDYLTKPIAFERLRDAVRRARTRLNARSADQRFADLQALVATLQSEDADGSNGHDGHLWVRRRDEMIRLPVGLIRLIEAQGDYVMLYTADGDILHRETVSSLESRLDPAAFARCHRSTIVNLDQVRAFRRRGKGLTLSLTDGRTIDVGPTYVDRLMNVTRLKRWRL
ncbi:LytR/AlgR family response regulator transcription factor [Brevundimonas sp.]|uniref:LytR/AlgR family response regulator transcription factor n=1 Tax=Brevundimonas sp. TaxID=1871086 RepID=UPI002FD997A1